jgi:hypothetical protein
MTGTEYLLEFFGAERYSQHAICLTNDPLMIGLYTVSDLTIFISYMVIGGVLMLCRSAGIVPRPIAFTLFASFILGCGFTHLTKVLTLFTGVYRLDVMVVAATASISLFTALFTLRSALDVRT